VGAHIGGQLNLLMGATVTNMTGPALNADHLTVDQNLLAGSQVVRGFMGLPERVRFMAEGAGGLGAVNFVGARIGGQLDFAGAALTNEGITLTKTAGPALIADGLKVGQSVFLRGGFTATGAGRLGAVHLSAAHVGSQLDLTDATLTNRDTVSTDTGAIMIKPTGPALDARDLTVGNDLIFGGEFAAQGEEDGVVLDLGMVQIGGGLYFHIPLDGTRDSADHGGLLNVDGLTYTGLPQKPAANGLPAQPATKEWLQLIRKKTSSYAAQPYQYLAAALGAAGNDEEARDVLIAQRQDQIDRVPTEWRERTWARFTGVMLGYGYRPSRALYYLLGVVITSVILSVVLGAHGGLAQSNPTTGKPASQCTTLQRIAVGLDLGEPLVSTTTQCNTTNSTTGEVLTIARWTLQVLAWALATLFIAGFTNAVRKT
jgi:hypothetical protein